jgi:4-amino-4-deoxy-L-arabinose transferase-like glycosyltransferase
MLVASLGLILFSIILFFLLEGNKWSWTAIVVLLLGVVLFYVPELSV